jgi:hypothetical protein
MRKLVSKALTNRKAHFIFFLFLKFDIVVSYVELLCLHVVSWRLAQPCRHGQAFNIALPI